LAGIIFFFAFNWNDLADLTKFGLVGAGFVLSILLWFSYKLDKPQAQAFGITATILIGVFLAVFGQVYQTPSSVHAPFVLWAVLALPFAIASKSRAHWAVWIIIAMVAFFAFLATGLNLDKRPQFPIILNILASAVTAGAIWIYNNRPFTSGIADQRDWFRLFLIVVCGVFYFVAFTQSFWFDEFGEAYSWLWIPAILLAGGLFYYLYKTEHHLPEMGLAAFGIVTLVAQIGWRVFELDFDETFEFLLLAVWMGLVTAGLAYVFRHLVRRDKTLSRPEMTENDQKIEDMRSNRPAISDFAKALGLENDGIQSAISERADDKTPWYFDLFIALSGFVTAILACIFFALLIGLILGDDNFSIYIALGMLVYGTSVFMRLRARNLFSTHFFNTLILAGGALAIVGVGLEFENEWALLIFSTALAALTLFLIRDRIIEFLMALCVAGGFAYFLDLISAPYPQFWMMGACSVAAVYLLSHSISRRVLTVTAIALLVASCGYAIFDMILNGWRLDNDMDPLQAWIRRGVNLLILIGVLIFANRGRKLPQDMRPQLTILLPLLVAIALMPPGGATALLMILLGYIVGSRALAIIGVLFQIYFLVLFYYDLDITLLQKSILLLISGILLVGVWRFSARRLDMAAVT